MKHTLTLVCTLLVLAMGAMAQTDNEPERIKKYFKKEKGKYGLWDKTQKKWHVTPEYDKITGIALSTKNYDVQNRIFFKLWKGQTFDLVRLTVNTSNYSDEFEIWVRDVDEIRPSNMYFESSSANWYNFVFFRQGSKWGWFSDKLDVLRNGRYAKEENVLFNPRFTTVPIVTTYCSKQFYSISPNNYIIQAGDAQNTGLYSLAGYEVVEPGPYKGFQMPESIDYGKDIFITTESKDGLYGYCLNGKTVPAAYKEIRKERNYVLNLDYYDCVFPDGAHELRKGTEPIAKSEIQAMEDALKTQRAEAEMVQKEKQESAARQEVQAIISQSAEMNPFDVADIVSKGNLNDMLLYCKKFGIEYTAAVNNDMREYTAVEPFDNGVKSFVDAGKDGLVVEFLFKETAQKQKFQDMLKDRGFTAKEVSAATGLITNGKADIWFVMGSNKWQISKSR